MFTGISGSKQVHSAATMSSFKRVISSRVKLPAADAGSGAASSAEAEGTGAEPAGNGSACELLEWFSRDVSRGVVLGCIVSLWNEARAMGRAKILLAIAYFWLA